MLEVPVKALTKEDLLQQRRKLESADYSTVTVASIARMTRTFLRWAKRVGHLKADFQEALEKLDGGGGEEAAASEGRGEGAGDYVSDQHG